MERLKKLLFGSIGGASRHAVPLPDEVHAALALWRGLPETDASLPHHQTRYVLLDITTTGLQVGQDRIRSIAAVALSGGVIDPTEAIEFELPEIPAGLPATESSVLDQQCSHQLMALLDFIGSSPVVAYPVPFVSAFLQPVFERWLGVDFKPYWLDLAQILPELFRELINTQAPIDEWLHCFGIEAPGRHDALVDALATARLLQVVLSRAVQNDLLTVAQLSELEKARRWLRPGT